MIFTAERWGPQAQVRVRDCSVVKIVVETADLDNCLGIKVEL